MLNTFKNFITKYPILGLDNIQIVRFRSILGRFCVAKKLSEIKCEEEEVKNVVPLISSALCKIYEASEAIHIIIIFIIWP